jgi:hypothetical protein
MSIFARHIVLELHTSFLFALSGGSKIQVVGAGLKTRAGACTILQRKDADLFPTLDSTRCFCVRFRRSGRRQLGREEIARGQSESSRRRSSKKGKFEFNRELDLRRSGGDFTEVRVNRMIGK